MVGLPSNSNTSPIPIYCSKINKLFDQRKYGSNKSSETMFIRGFNNTAIVISPRHRCQIIYNRFQINTNINFKPRTTSTVELPNSVTLHYFQPIKLFVWLNWTCLNFKCGLAFCLSLEFHIQVIIYFRSQ